MPKKTLPFTARPTRLTDRPVLARAVTEPKLAMALIASLTAEYAPGSNITRRELTESGQNARRCWFRAPRHYSASRSVVTRCTTEIALYRSHCSANNGISPNGHSDSEPAAN